MTATGDERQLDLGDIAVYVGPLRELPTTKFLNFGDLLDEKKVFEGVKSARQAERSAAALTQVTLGLDVSSLAPSQRVTKSNDGGTVTGEKSGVTTTTTTGSTSTTTTDSDKNNSQSTSGNQTELTETRSAGATAPATKLTVPQTGTAGLAASYHSLLYATAETVLAGKTLQSMFSIDSIPPGKVLVAAPVSIAVQPGRTTRKNYVAESYVMVYPNAACGISDASILAVAPPGLTSFMGDSDIVSRAMQLSAGVGIPLGSALAQLKGGLTEEEEESLAQVLRRPELQVAIVNSSTVKVRYLGTQALRGNVFLSPSTFQLDVLLLASIDRTRNPKACSAAIAQTKARNSSDPDPNSDVTKSLDKLVPGGLVDQRRLAASLVNEGYKGSLLTGTYSTFQPTQPFEDDSYTLDSYAFGEYQVVSLGSYNDPPAKVASIVQASDGSLLTTFMPLGDEPFTFCMKAARLGEDNALQTLIDVKPATVNINSSRSVSLRTGAQKSLKKTDTVYTLIARKEGACTEDADWQISPVTLAPEEKAGDEIVVRKVEAKLETKAIVARVEYGGSFDTPLIWINGTAATIRSLELQKAKNKVTGGVVYASVPETVSRKDEQERHVRVDVGAKDKTTVSMEVRASW